MPYGGVRRRPGPLLGGSAILAKRNNQQRLQYLQQLQNIVHPKQPEPSYEKVETNNDLSKKSKSDEATQNLYGVNIKISDHNISTKSPNQFSTSEMLISSPYPDLLSHEMPQANRCSSDNPISLSPPPSSQGSFQTYGPMYPGLGIFNIII